MWGLFPLTSNTDVFGRLRTSSEDFILPRESSEMIVSFSEIPRTPGRKVSRLYLTKSWQVYAHVHWNWPISGEQISKINLVCKNAVALTPYGSCGLLAMSWLQLYEFQNWKDHISSMPKTLILKPSLRKVEINAWWFEFSKIRIKVFLRAYVQDASIV